MKTSKQAIVFLTHDASPRIFAHFERLKKETHGLLDAFSCLHRPGGAQPGDAADFIITERDEAEFMPHRLGYRKEHSLPTGTMGFLDIIFLSVVQKLPGYDAYYMIEFDVDYAGDWKEVFGPISEREDDLIASQFCWRTHNPDWIHWNWHYSVPVVEPSKQVMAFIVLMRMSRRLVDLYIDALRSGQWIGNVEALLPTLALGHGLAMMDFGGLGDFTPTDWRDRFYIGHGTYGFRPVKGEQYYEENPAAFHETGKLYHPIKVAGIV